MTDLLGVMESWAASSTTLRAEDGTLTEIALTDIVSGKPVPPRASPRLRVSADEATRRANASWPAEHVEPLGEWLLRAAGGFSARANSAMAVGDPGMSFAEALARTEAFYARHGLPPWAQVTVGTGVHAAFEEAGWVRARPGEADSQFRIASVAQARRAAGRRLPAEPPLLTQRATVGAGWLASDPRAAAHERAARAVLEGPDQVVFVSAPPSGSRDEPATERDVVPLVCRGRAAISATGSPSPTSGSLLTTAAAVSPAWCCTRCSAGPPSAVPPPPVSRSAVTTPLLSPCTSGWAS